MCTYWIYSFDYLISELYAIITENTPYDVSLCPVLIDYLVR